MTVMIRQQALFATELAVTMQEAGAAPHPKCPRAKKKKAVSQELLLHRCVYEAFPNVRLSQSQQSRICLLYLPLFELLYQNLKQLSAQQRTSSPVLGLNVSAPAPEVVVLKSHSDLTCLASVQSCEVIYVTK